ncbi:MAG: Dam family site-specific DNA-(adenine-N6)-methyltransferase [Desulfobacteraceae bacterium]|nr:Dam family site-specific DNA-(adenine-N6)-methyltransferase [Desulfobacteraceae bacterium]
MKLKIVIPPIKCQGIKTKLVPIIRQIVQYDKNGKWIEPFMGSGVVGFNIKPENAVFADTNPHLIHFYNAISNGEIDSFGIRNFLENEGRNLSKYGKDYYYEVRDRFNKNNSPSDFLFLNRSCFNGVIRFNRKGGFNVPFGHKTERFSKAYVTKIINQIKQITSLSREMNWSFICQDFHQTLSNLSENDFVYCDPPYLGRHVDYYDSWDEVMEHELFALLDQVPCKFILSTWHSNRYRKNPFINTLWSKFNILTKEHFYHVGAKEDNRNAMTEALVMNFEPKQIVEEASVKSKQSLLFERSDYMN